MALPTPTISTVTDVTGFDVSVPGAETLWEMPAVLLPQWAQAMSLTTSWPLNIVLARNLAEKRTGYSSKPLRTVSVTLDAFKARELWQLFNVARRAGSARFMLPIYMDHTRLRADTSNSATMQCDTTCRRFFVGQRILVGDILPTQHGWGPEYGRWHIYKIASLTATSITVAGPYTAAFTRGARVYPIMECDLTTQHELGAITGTVGSITLKGTEAAGRSALPPIVPESDYLNWRFYDSRPIFEFDEAQDASGRGSITLTSHVNRSSIGTGTMTERLGDRPIMGRKGTLRSQRRETAWNFLRMRDACSGGLRPFIVNAPVAMFRVNSYNDALKKMTLEPSGPVSDLLAYPYLYVKLVVDGEVRAYVSEIVSVNRNEVEDVLVLKNALPITSLAMIVLATVGFLGRFDGEDLTEQWTTDETTTIDYSITEVVNEKATELVVGNPSIPTIIPVPPDDGGDGTDPPLGPCTTCRGCEFGPSTTIDIYYDKTYNVDDTSGNGFYFPAHNGQQTVQGTNLKFVPEMSGDSGCFFRGTLTSTSFDSVYTETFNYNKTYVDVLVRLGGISSDGIYAGEYWAFDPHDETQTVLYIRTDNDGPGCGGLNRTRPASTTPGSAVHGTITEKVTVKNPGCIKAPIP